MRMAASCGARSRKAWKRSTGSSWATSGRSSASLMAAISASSRCSGASSAAGAISISSVSPRLRCEKVDAHRAVLGRGIDVEDPASDGELAAIVDLVDALVAGGDELMADLVEVDQVADADRERVRAQLGVGDLLAQRDRADDHDRRLLALAA